MSVTRITLSVAGMNCASCVRHVEQAAREVPGVASCDVNLPLGRAAVSFDPAITNLDAIISSINETGYTATVFQTAAPKPKKSNSADKWFRRTVAGLILWFPVELTHWLMIAAGHGHMEPGMVWVSLITSTLSMAYVGSAFYRGAWSALRRRTSNMDTLIALGASVAYGYSLIALLGRIAKLWPDPAAYYFMESSGLLALISLGHWLEARAAAPPARPSNN